ncbi:DUF3592 domain-containing protein [Microbulbifer halophilus]|uniref:DUF3592 domain-containing protein n=1 Tax=Microbulbifer halophilus TaxID=453963 RepID=A0ABW5E8H9_9GAMM|nr:DUF3592 domain-containing protein [Microbulbifer halophilus]MCW8125522.1 DUF3592 domain-containing protein [Microbulbifer halophilus]
MKAVSILKYVFTAIGLGLLIGAFFSYKSTQDFLGNALATEGTVIELVRSRSSDSVTYAPVVKFMTRDGSLIEFMSSSSSNPPSYYEGEKVEVLYQEFSPQQARINGFFSLWGVASILGVLGAVFSLVGLSIILFGKLKGRKIKYLKENGISVNAKFTGVELNSSLEVNGRHPYRISAQWKNPATSEIHIFNSENIWFDPSDHIDIDELTVLIEKDNPKKYHVDTSFLPKVAS